MSKWGKLIGVGRVVAAIVGTIVPGVAKVEQLAEALPHLKGSQKQDAVLQIAISALEASESLADKDLLNNPEVEAATRAVIDAIVHLHNVSAKHLTAGS